MPLPNGAGDHQLAQTLVDRIDQIAESSQLVADSQKRYDAMSKKADGAGISHVVTAGNLAPVKEQMDALGVRTDDDFYKSVLVNDHTTVAGAVDDHGTNDPGDDTPFDGNSPQAGAEVSAPGVNVPLTTQDGAKAQPSGTSIAAPALCGRVGNLPSPVALDCRP